MMMMIVMMLMMMIVMMLMLMIVMMMMMIMMMMQVRPAEASSAWSPDTGVLTIRAPVAIMAADLRF